MSFMFLKSPKVGPPFVRVESDFDTTPGRGAGQAPRLGGAMCVPRLIGISRALVIAAFALLLVPAGARADLASLKESCHTADALDGRRSNAIQIPYRLCDDGLPRVGGRTPNQGAVRAVRVPERYADYRGLPRGVSPDPNAGADSRGSIALDANVALPDPRRHPRPHRGLPADRPAARLLPGLEGAVARDDRRPRGEVALQRRLVRRTRLCRPELHLAGVRERAGRGSTGESQFGHRAYEVNDLQYLAGLLAEDPFFGVNPQRVVVSGASFGAGVAWLALTDPIVEKPSQADRHAPRRGRSQARLDRPRARARPERAATCRTRSLPPIPRSRVSRSPLGAPKRSLLVRPPDARGLRPRDRGRPCVPDVARRPCCEPGLRRGPGRASTRSSATAPPTSSCASSAGSPSTRPHGSPCSAWAASPTSCSRSRNIAGWRTTLRSIVPDYPVKEYYGDFGDLAQNKGKEWADLCDRDDHPCAVDDYKRGFNITPRRFMRFGVATRLNRFLDHYARPPGNTAPAAARDTT